MNRAVLAVALSFATFSEAQEDLGAIAQLEVWRHERFLLVRNAEASDLAAFTTDGCSGGMSSAWRTVAQVFPSFRQNQGEVPPWERCCVTHDEAYHLGGDGTSARTSYDARLAADEALQQCVKAVAREDGDALQARYGEPQERIEIAFDFIADRMLEAVRVGGAPCSGLPWRWGYGWPHCW
ncbi:hypothetical protein BXY66_1451 [Shimia isoporae]|uniref:Uncharacterized protein n=1 Tax=Shimia isoporae TaxID=647720 RepID=A0A4R1NML0_9RHOB|nr:hypothetical protein [Shimia isoporae]TCL09405.1 hypothetical protein BXY66_1451 [Shimia isoporae]